VSELGTRAGIRGFDVRLLRPTGSIASKDIDSAGIISRCVILVAVDPFSSAALVRGAYRHGIPVGADGYSVAGVTVEHAATTEMIVGMCIRSFDIGGLPQLFLGFEVANNGEDQERCQDV
jgi:hypothetical protein